VPEAWGDAPHEIDMLQSQDWNFRGGPTYNKTLYFRF
jgi:hypothetical protein